MAAEIARLDDLIERSRPDFEAVAEQVAELPLPRVDAAREKVVNDDAVQSAVRNAVVARRKLKIRNSNEVFKNMGLNKALSEMDEEKEKEKD